MMMAKTDRALPTPADALNALKVASRFYKTKESDEQILNEIANIENN